MGHIAVTSTVLKRKGEPMDKKRIVRQPCGLSVSGATMQNVQTAVIHSRTFTIWITTTGFVDSAEGRWSE